MSEQKSPESHAIPIWGIFLLFLGIVFLLQTLNVLPWGLWGTLWRFWPALIIAIGLGILLRRYNPWLISALILALFGAFLGIAIWQYEASTPAGETAASYSVPVGSMASAQIQIDFTAGSLNMGSLQPGSSNFVEVASEAKNGNGSIRADFTSQNSEGKLYLSTEHVNRQFWDKLNSEVRIARDIPLTLEVEAAVSNLDLDLGQLQVTELRMDIDAGNYTVRMPSSAGVTRAYIKADVANIEVTIPDGVAAKIRVNVNLAALEVDESRFPREGNYYISDDFESAENRIELDIDCNIGRVQIK